MLTQKRLRLSVRPVPGESFNAYRFRTGELVRHVKAETIHATPEKLLSDLLKRQARAAMGDVTKCQPSGIAGHLARLESLCEICEHFMRHELAETGESLLSGRQLAYPSTVADFVACMELTRRNHRCPEFVNPAEDFQREIVQRLDLLAFQISKIQPMAESEVEA